MLSHLPELTDAGVAAFFDGWMGNAPLHTIDLSHTVWEISQKMFRTFDSLIVAPTLARVECLNIHFQAPTLSQLTSMHFYRMEEGLKNWDAVPPHTACISKSSSKSSSSPSTAVFQFGGRQATIFQLFFVGSECVSSNTSRDTGSLSAIGSVFMASFCVFLAKRSARYTGG